MAFKKIPASKLSSLKLDVTYSFKAKNSSTISIKPILLKAVNILTPIFDDIQSQGGLGWLWYVCANSNQFRI